MNEAQGGESPGLEVTGATDSSVPGLSPTQAELFNDWLSDPATPPGGVPTGGVEQAIANADDFWMRHAIAAVKDEARSGRVFEAFDVEERYGLVPDHPNRWGALMRIMIRERIVTRIGYAPSRRPSRNGGITGQYKGAQC